MEQILQPSVRCEANTESQVLWKRAVLTGTANPADARSGSQRNRGHSAWAALNLHPPASAVSSFLSPCLSLFPPPVHTPERGPQDTQILSGSHYFLKTARDMWRNRVGTAKTFLVEIVRWLQSVAQGCLPRSLGCTVAPCPLSYPFSGSHSSFDLPLPIGERQ